MNKLIVILGVGAVFCFIGYCYFWSNSDAVLADSSKQKLFYLDTNVDIRKHLDSSSSIINLGDIYTLIELERNDILEVLMKEYMLSPDFKNDIKIDTPLLFASENLKLNSVKLLIKYGADVNYQNNEGQTALFKAATSTNLASSNEELDYRRQIVKLLVLSGADINIATNFNRTVMKTIVFDGDMELVQFLVENGGDLNYIDQDGANYLFYCNKVECLKYFVNKGLNINSTQKNGENIIQGAVFSSFVKIDVIKEMLELGVDICHLDNDGNNVIDLAILTDITPHLKSDNPEFYYKKIEENRNSDVYQFLEKEYLKKCETIKEN